MHRLAAAAVIAALAPGCITTMGLVKHQEDVSKANIITTGVLDLAGGTFFMFSAEGLSTGGALLSAIAFTAVDLGVACLLGTCQVLHP